MVMKESPEWAKKKKKFNLGDGSNIPPWVLAAAVSCSHA